MAISFSPPYMDDSIYNEVVETLKSGWITTGPKAKLLEKEVADYCGVQKVLSVNSATSAMMLVLNWFGIGKGDEVIIPAYTYCATALSVIHLGAKPVMVDVGNDFNIDPQKILLAITAKTKAIIAVDFGGWPCKYKEVYALINDKKVKSVFKAVGGPQKSLGRVLLLADSAHGLGSIYGNKLLGSIADVTVFSLHAVKNVTAAEGGLIAFNMPEPFNNHELYDTLKLWSTNGQTKDAFTKTMAGNWRYDILVPGFKMNFPDVLAAIAFAQFKKYKTQLREQRKKIFDLYDKELSRFEWAICPPFHSKTEFSSYHLYPFRVRNCKEEKRNKIIEILASFQISVNVHFVPLPMLSLFKRMGYKIENYPTAFKLYANEISLPIYPQLPESSCIEVVNKLENAFYAVAKKKKEKSCF